MPESSPAVSAETTESVSQTPETPVTPAAPASPREEIYAKYASLYGSPEESVEPAVTPEPEGSPVPEVTEVAAETPKEETVVPDSAPAQQPSATDAVLAKLTELLGAQSTRMQQMEERYAASLPKPEPVPEPELEFISKLRDGDVKGAEQAMRASILAELKAESKAPVDPQVLVQSAVEHMRLENDLTNYLKDLRVQNPDIMPMEKFIAFGVEQTLSELKAQGKLTSGQAYADAYKKAVNENVAEARKIIQTSRAAGKTEANTTKTEVLRTSTLTPAPVNPDRGMPKAETGAPDISAEGYLAKRMARLHSGQGLIRN